VEARSPHTLPTLISTTIITLIPDCHTGSNPDPNPNPVRQDEITAMIAKMGENLSLRRVNWLEVDEGVVSTYIHTKTAEGIGRLGVMVALEVS